MKRALQTLLIAGITTLPLGLLAKEVSPVAVCDTVQGQLAENSKAVGILGRGATGFIVSEDGLVLSACHVVESKSNIEYPFLLADGTKLKVKFLGANRETDVALFKVIDVPEGGLPFVELSDKAVSHDEYCYAIGYPGGAKHSQLRLGMVRYFTKEGEKNLAIAADAFIQPGDSGCPLFNAEGKVIGICSNIPHFLNTNRYATMDMYFRDREKLLKLDGKIMGQKGVGIMAPLQLKPDQALLTKITDEFQRRCGLRYRYAQLEVERRNGSIDTQGVLEHFNCELMAYIADEPVTLGADDPAVHKLLPNLPENGILPIQTQGKQASCLLPCGDGIGIMRLDRWDETTTIKTQAGDVKLAKLAELKNANLCLVKMPDLNGDFVWPKSVESVKQGDMLVTYLNAVDKDWGVVTSDQKQDIKISKGWIHDAKLLSAKCQMKQIITHDIDLFAKDACTPVYNKDGLFVGIHFHRKSRTIGYIMPAADLQAYVTELTKLAN